MMGNLRQILLTTNGRLPRSIWWFFILAGSVASIFYMLLISRALSITLKDLSLLVGGSGLRSPQGRVAILLMLPWWTLWFGVGLSIGVKRLHDRNRTGW